ncbi:hypothetical protein Smar_0480 [Staphylothermus marinus F1]|uniref:Uncharacterized protein n=1 Tax=Staphylothermus marinus (strain ATCC 43588 / DSM 3639 / JCM 9404 / F1) TaxID=399550 RepID=A3DLS8_STAMF|nr:hypothetical protein [Staphylothermus marinus]ABN69588.1 hypothetical protein Smar_0480 [Staphylothermus marinus F1]
MVKDTLIEARNVVRSAMESIDRRILSRSTELKARTVSVASRIYEVLNFIDAILGGVIDRVGEEDASRIVSFGTYFYLAPYEDSFTLVRSKPYMITISYKKGEGKLYVKTKNFKAEITPSTMELTKLSMKIKVDLRSPEDISKKLPEIKYLLRSLGRIIEYQLLPVAEKRLGLKL